MNPVVEVKDFLGVCRICFTRKRIKISGRMHVPGTPTTLSAKLRTPSHSMVRLHTLRVNFVIYPFIRTIYCEEIKCLRVGFADAKGLS